MAHPSPQTLPKWLALAMESTSHVRSGLRAIAVRESNRMAARHASEELDLKNADSSGEDYHIFYHYSVSTGIQDMHIDKNRYSDILPYDRTRAVVNHRSTHGYSPGSGKALYARYLNANWVLERFGHKWWIAAQAPLQHTAHAFLSAIVQSSMHPLCIPTPLNTGPSSTRTSRIRTAVQLTRNVENGRKKADVYFPTEVGQSLIVPPEQGCFAPALRVTLIKKESIEEAHCIQSTVSISPVRQPLSPTATTEDYVEPPPDEEIVFRHLLYLSWPDHGVPGPEDRDSLLAFIHLVDATNRDKSHCRLHPNSTPDHSCTELDPDPPILVGCSAGVGRTGSFIATSSLLRNYGFLPAAARPTMPSAVEASPLGPLPPEFEDDLVLQEVDFLREQRPGMVQKDEQAILVYDILISLFTKNLRVGPSR